MTFFGLCDVLLFLVIFILRRHLEEIEHEILFLFFHTLDLLRKQKFFDAFLSNTFVTILLFRLNKDDIDDNADVEYNVHSDKHYEGPANLKLNLLIVDPVVECKERIGCNPDSQLIYQLLHILQRR